MDRHRHMEQIKTFTMIKEFIGFITTLLSFVRFALLLVAFAAIYSGHIMLQPSTPKTQLNKQGNTAKNKKIISAQVAIPAR